MRLLRAIARRTAVSVMTIGLAAAATVAMSSPSHAADDVTVTMRVTLNIPITGPAVAIEVNGKFSGSNCHRRFVLGQTRELRVTAPKGAQIRLYPSVDCYFLKVPRSEILSPEYDGQVFDVTLDPAPQGA